MSINTRVTVGKDENIEKAIKKFKRQCDKLGIKKEVKQRSYYESPGEKRRREKRKNDRNRKKDADNFERSKREPKPVWYIEPPTT